MNFHDFLLDFDKAFRFIFIPKTKVLDPRLLQEVGDLVVQ